MSFDFSTVTYDKLVATAEELVGENGSDFVYQPRNGCVYVEINDDDHSAFPSCFVGQIFFRLGMTMSELLSWDNNDSVDGEIDFLLEQRYDNPLDSRSVKFLAVLQANQDFGTTWGDSLCDARTATDLEN